MLEIRVAERLTFPKVESNEPKRTAECELKLNSSTILTTITYITFVRLEFQLNVLLIVNKKVLLPEKLKDALGLNNAEGRK